jgi:hypothetical protein
MRRLPPRRPSRRRNPAGPAKAHAFEAAGLGRAPFEIVGFVAHKGSCAFCGHRLAGQVVVRDADGRQFTVGEDCAERTGDEGLVQALGAIRRRIAKERRAAKKEAAWRAEIEAAYREAADLVSGLVQDLASLSGRTPPAAGFAAAARWAQGIAREWNDRGRRRGTPITPEERRTILKAYDLEREAGARLRSERDWLDLHPDSGGWPCDDPSDLHADPPRAARVGATPGCRRSRRSRT